MSGEGSFCNLYIVNTPKEQNAGVSMVQKRRQRAWKTENQRKRSKKIARKRRRVIAYTVRGIMAAVLAVMILLMICADCKWGKGRFFYKHSLQLL